MLKHTCMYGSNTRFSASDVGVLYRGCTLAKTARISSGERDVIVSRELKKARSSPSSCGLREGSQLIGRDQRGWERARGQKRTS